MLRRDVRVAVTAMAIGCGACSLLTDLDSLTGGPTPDLASQTEAGVPVGSSCGSGGVCALSPPEGWSLVAMRLGTASDCPDGFTSPRDLVEVPASVPPASCSCSCGRPPAPAACAGTGNLLAARGSSALTCVAIVNVPASGTCSPLELTPIEYLRVDAVGPAQRPCPATVTTVRPPLAPAPTRVCSLATPPMADGCTLERRCVPRPTAPYALCASALGTPPCPPVFPNRTVLGASLVDGRGCSDCVCRTNDTCSNARVELFSTSVCAGSPAKAIAANGKCRPIGGSGRYSSVRYATDVAPAEACQIAVGPEPSGTVTADELRVVCCP